jgi:hypothetical protein
LPNLTYKEGHVISTYKKGLVTSTYQKGLLTYRSVDVINPAARVLHTLVEGFPP